jgi:hypothetical protein
MLRGVRAAGDRRSFISGIAAAGLGAYFAPALDDSYRPLRRHRSSQRPSLIDVHHHFVPPFYLSENQDRIVAAGGGRMNPAYLSWTPEKALAAMDESRRSDSCSSSFGVRFLVRRPAGGGEHSAPSE